MVRRLRSSIALALVFVVATGCSKETGQGEEAARPTGAAAAEERTPSVVDLDTTGRAVTVTHRPTGRTHVLFEDETVEDSEEGTFHALLSRFGPYVSYSTEWYYEGGAHPSYGKTYTAITVGETIQEADLRTLFSEEVVYEAMQQTPLVQQTPLTHATLGELIDGLAATYECEMAFEGFFSSFFVSAVQEETAEVVVGLTHGCEVQRGNFTTFTLKMNVPEDKRAAFNDLQTFNRE